MSQAEPVFDIAQIDESWGSADDDTYHMVLGIFAPEARQLCADIRAALAHDERARLQRLAHTLRGASSNVAATLLASRAGAVERASTDAGADHLAGLLAELENALRVTDAVISAGGPQEGD